MEKLAWFVDRFTKRTIIFAKYCEIRMPSNREIVDWKTVIDRSLIEEHLIWNTKFK